MTVMAAISYNGKTPRNKDLWDRREGRPKELCMTQAWWLGFSTGRKETKKVNWPIFLGKCVSMIIQNKTECNS